MEKMNYKYILTAFLSVVLTFFLVSCNDDEDQAPVDKRYSITFYVCDGIIPVVGAEVSIGELKLKKTTDASGKVTFIGMLQGDYDYDVSLMGYKEGSGTVSLVDAAITEDVTLKIDSAAKKFKIMSYNIKHCQNADGKVDVQGTANVIKESGADIVLLQEVDVETTRSHNIDEPAELARLIGMQSVFGKAVDCKGGEYGVAILSKYPIIDVKNILLPWNRGTEQRTSLWATIVVGQDTIVAVSTHLQVGNDPIDVETRLQQTEHIIPLIQEKNYPVLFGGDLNEAPSGTAIQKYKETMKFSDKEPYTFTSNAINPKKKADYIMMSKPEIWELHDYQVINEPYASDHRPIISTVKLNKSPIGVNPGEDVSTQ